MPGVVELCSVPAMQAVPWSAGARHEVALRGCQAPGLLMRCIEKITQSQCSPIDAPYSRDAFPFMAAREGRWPAPGYPTQRGTG